MKHFLIFSMTDACYDSYRYFSRSLSDALTAAGHRVTLFSTATEAPEAMERFVGLSFDAIFDFNSTLPRLLMEEGGYFLDQIHAPFYDILLDHPLYHHDSLKQGLSDFHVLCLDENHRQYCRACYPHISSANLFPVTGEDQAPHDPSYPQKRIDVLFCGTYTNYREVEASIKTCPPVLGDLTKRLISIMQEDDSLTQEAALYALLPSLEEAELIQETFPLHMQACFLCDSYLRAQKRERLLLALAQKNIPLTLCGNGFQSSPLADFKHVSILDDIAFADTFLLFRNAKITLNLLPEFKNGAHDRIFSAMLNHSLCLTDASDYLKKQFTDGKDLIFYDARHPKNLAEQIFELLASPQTIARISQEGYFRAKERHSWQARVADLLSFI